MRWGIAKKDHNKKEKVRTFRVGQRVLLWDSSNKDKGKHTKFEKLWLGPFSISYNLGNNTFFLKDIQERLFSHITYSEWVCLEALLLFLAR